MTSCVAPLCYIHSLGISRVSLSETWRNSEVARSLGSLGRPLSGVALFSAVINILALAPSIYMLQVYDRVLTGHSVMTLTMLTLMVIVCYALSGLLERCRNGIIVRLGMRFDWQLSQRVYRAGLEDALRDGGRHASVVLNDVTHLRQFLTGGAIFALFDAPWFPIYLLVMFLFHPWLGTVSLLGALLLTGLAVANQLWTRAPLREANQHNLKAQVEAGNGMLSPAPVMAMGMQEAMFSRWMKAHSQSMIQQQIASDRAAIVAAITKNLRLFLQSFILGVGAVLVIQGEATGGLMIAGSILMGRVLAPIEQVIASWKLIGPARSSCQRIDTLLREHPERATPTALPAPQGVLTVEGLSYQAPGSDRWALHDINFSLAPGQVLGIIGPSGAGKSTLARLLVGLNAPTQGKIRLDQADLAHWDRERLGQHLGYLPQEVTLHAGTIRDNIARFSEKASDERVIEAARAAQAHELILQLPQGYDTVLHADGSPLSGGQRQRIALARALYDTPALIVLDEPNAALDDQGERALAIAIDRLRQAKRTLVVVSHHRGLLSVTSHVLVLVNGTAQQFDTTQNVLARLQQATQRQQGDQA